MTFDSNIYFEGMLWDVGKQALFELLKGNVYVLFFRCHRLHRVSVSTLHFDK